MSLLASSSTTHGFGGNSGIAGASHHFGGWQEAGPPNPHHPELGLPRFIQDCFKSTAIIRLEDGTLGRGGQPECEFIQEINFIFTLDDGGDFFPGWHGEIVSFYWAGCRSYWVLRWNIHKA